MTKYYFNLTLETLIELAEKKGLRFTCHPFNGCTFFSGHKEVGWSESKPRKIAEFIDTYPYDEDERPMDPKEAHQLLVDHFLDQTFVDQDVSRALMALGEAAELHSITYAALDAGLDVEIARTAPGTHYCRLWRDGDLVAEREEESEPGVILARLLDELREKEEIR